MLVAGSVSAPRGRTFGVCWRGARSGRPQSHWALERASATAPGKSHPAAQHQEHPQTPVRHREVMDLSEKIPRDTHQGANIPTHWAPALPRDVLFRPRLARGPQKRMRLWLVWKTASGWSDLARLETADFLRHGSRRVDGRLRNKDENDQEEPLPVVLRGHPRPHDAGVDCMGFIPARPHPVDDHRRGICRIEGCGSQAFRAFHIGARGAPNRGRQQLPCYEEHSSKAPEDDAARHRSGDAQTLGIERYYGLERRHRGGGCGSLSAIWMSPGETRTASQ